MSLSQAPAWAQREPALGRAGAAPGLVPRVRRLHPVRGLRELADWFRRNGRLDRAWEIVAFALAHDPRDYELLKRAAELNRALGDPAAARAYARKGLAVRPGDSRLAALLEALQPAAPASPSTTAPAEAAAPGDETGDGAEAAAEGPPLSLARKLHVLGLLRMLRSAIAAYDQHHPKKPLEELGLDALRGDGLLPADFADPDLEAVSYADGVLRHAQAGSLDELAESVGEYRLRLGAAGEWVARGHPHEALADLKALEADFGTTPDIRALRHRALREIDPSQAWMEAADRPEADAASTLAKALDLWRDEDVVGARETLARLRRTWPESPHAEVAGRLETLAARDLPLDFLYSFYETRARSVAASEATTEAGEDEAAAPPDGEPEDAKE